MVQNDSGADLSRLERTRSSVYWSAWADALGFISELVDEGGLARRTAGRPLDEPMQWVRRVGGKFGATATLPDGTFSDDTQLRLSVARAISSRGFDVSSFAKVELTVWPSYALGGGRASKAAAANLAKPNVTWSTNFYDGWSISGGNGAAMRIQPHVWAARDLNKDDFLVDVLRDAVTTHGHPRALVGAVLHAVALAHAIEFAEVPDERVWRRLLDRTAHAHRLFSRDRELDEYWLSTWARQSPVSMESAWLATVEECARLIGEGWLAMRGAGSDEVAGALVDPLGLRNPQSRGSGTGTVVAALLLAYAHRDSAYRSAVAAANCLGTDTDTIATMAAGIVGAVTPRDHHRGRLQDEAYLGYQADRLWKISQGTQADAFAYPDPLRWQPPRTQLDALGLVDGRPSVAGLGPVTMGESFESADSRWSWVSADFGATMLIKHRPNLRELSSGSHSRVARTLSAEGEDRKSVASPALFDERLLVLDPNSSKPVAARVPRYLLDDLMSEIQASGFDAATIGSAVRLVSEEGSVDQLVTFIKSLRSLLRG